MTTHEIELSSWIIYISGLLSLKKFLILHIITPHNLSLFSAIDAENRPQTCAIIFTLFELYDEWFKRILHNSFTTVLDAETSERK